MYNQLFFIGIRAFHPLMGALIGSRRFRVWGLASEVVTRDARRGLEMARSAPGSGGVQGWCSGVLRFGGRCPRSYSAPACRRGSDFPRLAASGWRFATAVRMRNRFPARVCAYPPLALRRVARGDIHGTA